LKESCVQTEKRGGEKSGGQAEPAPICRVKNRPHPMKRLCGRKKGGYEAGIALRARRKGSQKLQKKQVEGTLRPKISGLTSRREKESNASQEQVERGPHHHIRLRKPKKQERRLRNTHIHSNFQGRKGTQYSHPPEVRGGNPRLPRPARGEGDSSAHKKRKGQLRNQGGNVDKQGEALHIVRRTLTG